MIISVAILFAILHTPFLNYSEAFTKSEYEEKYKTILVKKEADEIIHQPLKRLAYGSCQRTYPQLQTIYDTILKYDPDLFLFIGDNFYTDMNCCNEECITKGYQRMVNFPPFQEFKRKVRKFDGVYDDHDFGINDGDATFKYKDYSLNLLMDFMEKPPDHYRRKRVGGYYSESYIDPENPKNHVKVIVLDTRYFRSCLYNCLCQVCGLTFLLSRYIMLRRLFNSHFGIGCRHPGDVLGDEQWNWFQSQLVDSEASAHVIVSSFQVLTHFSMGESWGHLPFAKKRLMDLLEATRPKKPIFISGDVHFGERTDRYGLVEFTSSSLTHSVRPYNNYTFFFLYPFYLFSKRCTYLYNNFGGIDFNYNSEKDVMEWDGAIYNVEGVGALHYRSRYEDLYEHVDKPDSFFRDYRLVKCLTKTQLLCRVSIIVVILLSPPMLFIYLLLRYKRKSKRKRRRPKRD